MEDLIRASVIDIVHSDEIQDFVDDGLFKEYSDVFAIQELARKILAHKCTRRCKARIGDKEGPENFRCRKTNELMITPDNTNHCYLPMTRLPSPDCLEKLIEIGLADNIEFNEWGYGNEFKSSLSFPSCQTCSSYKPERLHQHVTG